MQLEEWREGWEGVSKAEPLAGLGDFRIFFPFCFELQILYICLWEEGGHLRQDLRDNSQRPLRVSLVGGPFPGVWVGPLRDPPSAEREVIQ